MRQIGKKVLFWIVGVMFSIGIYVGFMELLHQSSTILLAQIEGVPIEQTVVEKEKKRARSQIDRKAILRDFDRKTQCIMTVKDPSQCDDEKDIQKITQKQISQQENTQATDVGFGWWHRFWYENGTFIGMLYVLMIGVLSVETVRFLERLTGLKKKVYTTWSDIPPMLGVMGTMYAMSQISMASHSSRGIIETFRSGVMDAVGTTMLGIAIYVIVSMMITIGIMEE